MNSTRGRQNGHCSVCRASGGGAGSVSVPGSAWSVRLKAIRLVRPVMGCVRISMIFSTASPDGDINLAEMDSLTKERGNMGIPFAVKGRPPDAGFAHVSSMSPIVLPAPEIGAAQMAAPPAGMFPVAARVGVLPVAARVGAPQAASSPVGILPAEAMQARVPSLAGQNAGRFCRFPHSPAQSFLQRPPPATSP